MCALYDEQTKLWTAADRRLSESKQHSLGHVILNWLSSRGSKLAQINDDTGVQVTYHELWLNTIRAAQNLLKMGFKPRQKFCFMIYNNDHLIPALVASICLICPIVPLHPMLSKDEIARILIQIQPVALFCEANLYDRIDEVLSEIGIDVKLFIFDEHIANLESVERLMDETGEEETFV
ncbi:uncharacterized protein LOC119085535 [Bradysia coprophila]|uniref:uncharacterized protein LOC119085535 n=1 Tax=Bradysia coprophila TaxID=38358 RepID=UPI00187DD827|nr:uncharacterized protein LOC119085535 [Bradysia coprophila]